MVSKKSAPTKKVATKVAGKSPITKIPTRKAVTAAPSAPAATAFEATAPAAPSLAVAAPASLAVSPAMVADTHELVRDSFTMPRREYELLDVLKGRLMLLSRAAKKSELLRAGVVTLARLSDVELLAAVNRIPSLKTGRPKKVKDGLKATKKKS